MWQALLAGGTLGLVSSFHCVGMCGPLALSLPVQHLPRYQQYSAFVLYNIGRVITYSLLGLLFGLAGRQLFIAGWQQWFSISMGILILLMAGHYFFLKNYWEPRWLQRFHFQVQQLMSRFLRSGSPGAYTLLGMANGLLPCGMVYLAIAGALSTQETLQSVGFMAAFGLATLPAMLVLSLLGMRVDISVRRSIRKLMPVVVTAVAVVLILRGLNLGIPFISPVLAAAPGNAASCH